MVKIKAIIKDEDNPNFEVEAYATVNERDFLIYEDCMNIFSCDEYESAYDRICECFQNQNNLPYNWYFDADIEKVS